MHARAMECLGEDVVVDWARGTLSPGDRARVEQHVDACPDCRRLLATLARGEPASSEQIDLVDRYMIETCVGSGGMGVVYAARDPELRRTVAIKLLRAELARPEIQHRLLREAQAMARLSHPNVITVYDVGTHDGQVFVAMELVDGGTLREWCRGRPWREILDAYLAAGRGLQSAHAASIVHRDFKPDNVLIGRDGRVRVTDFGLATESGAASAAVGTPAYMSPEQHAGGRADARSDQFSYCVALDEALGAWVPSSVKRVLARGRSIDPDARWPSMRELIRALERAASPRFSGRAIAIAVAIAGAVAAIAIGFLLARAFSRDERAWPCGGSDAQLAGVWDAARRDAIRSSFLATELPYAADAWRSVEAALDRHTRDWIAMRADACAATMVRREASPDVYALRTVCLAERLEEVRALSDLFAHADPGVVERAPQAASSLTPLATCADVARLAQRPAEGPQAREIRAALLRAQALRRAGRYHDAVSVAGPAALAAAGLGHRPLQAEALLLLGETQIDAGDLASAERSLRDAIRAAEAERIDDTSARAWIALIDAVGYLGARETEGIEIARHALAAIERLGGDASLEGEARAFLGGTYWTAGKIDDAEREMERAIELLTRARGPDHHDVAVALDGLGLVKAEKGDVAAALELHRRSLAIRERTVGADHPNVAFALDNVGGVAWGLGRFDEAERAFARSLAIRERALAPDHPMLAMSLNNLGVLALSLDEPERAHDLLARALAITRRAHPERHPLSLTGSSNVADALRELGRVDEAEAMHRRAVELARPDHVDLALYLHGWGRDLLELGRWDRAEAALSRGLALLERIHGSEHHDVANFLTALAEVDLARRRPERAARKLERALATRGAIEPDSTTETKFLLARALWDVGRDRPRARTLADEARAEWVAAGKRGRRRLAAVDAWLAAHAAE